MAAHSPIMPAIRAFAERGGYVLGVCNGFQILTEAGLLPGALLRNANLRFLSRDCHLRVERADTAFTRHYQTGQVFPRPHGAWRRQLFRRCRYHEAVGGTRTASPSATPRPDGRIGPDSNPNGSLEAIAGVYSQNLRVLGLMPHPGGFD